MRTYAIKIGKELTKVRGFIQATGWLDWRSADGSSGLTRPGYFCEWKERKQVFPDCVDATEKE